MLSRFSCGQLFVAPWTGICQSPPSMGFPRQEYRSGLPFPSTGDLPDPGIEPTSPALAGGLSTTEPPGNPPLGYLLSMLLPEKLQVISHLLASVVIPCH